MTGGRELPARPAVAQDRAALVCLPAPVRRQGTALLNQQFWLWGQDIRRAEGNALLRHGFTRQRPPAGVRGSSAYTLDLGAGRAVTLWGFGFAYRDPAAGSLYVSRFRLAPLLLGTPGNGLSQVWEPTRLPPRRKPTSADDWARAHALLVPALRWVSAYEHWVVAVLGLEYRQACVAAWRRPMCQAEQVAGRWQRLASRCDATLRRAVRKEYEIQ